MADAEQPDAAAAQAAAQAIADRLAAQHQPGEFTGEEGGNGNNNKRKYEEDEQADGEASHMRKRASFNGPEDADNAVEGADITGTDPAGATLTAEYGADPQPQVQPQVQQAPTVTAPQMPQGQPVDVMEIPTSMVGKLIGRSGETIKQLSFTTGTRIQIDHQGQGDTKKVTIEGETYEHVEQAKKAIQSLMSEEGGAGFGEVSRSVECPQGIVGRVIGRGGETIRALQQASQAHIVVDQSFPDGVPRKVNVTGKADAVDRAVNMVTELINGEPGSAQAIIQKYGAGVTKVMECPKSMVGRVIGKGGETIKSLQKTYGANIQIDQSTDPMKVTVSGQPGSVDSAVAAVYEIINGGNPLGIGGPAAGGFGTPGFGAPSYPPASYGGYGGFPPAAAAPAPAPYGYGYGYPSYPPAGGGYGGYGGYSAPAADPYGASGYGGGGGYGGQGGGAPQGGGAGPWQELHDSEGRPYYYNSQTGESQWEKPAGM